MWETVKLGDVCEIQPKKAQVKKKLADTDTVSFMPMDDLGIDEMHPIANQTKTLAKAYSSYTYFEDNDVLLAKITPCFENGKLGIATNLANGVGFGSSEYIVLRCGKQVLPQYIYYHLNQPSFRANGKAQMSGAVGHKRVPKDFVENLEISLPPLAEQQRIVAKLDAAFAEIDRAVGVDRERVASMISLEQALLEETFSADYPSTNIGDLGDVKSGGTPKSKEPAYWGGSIQWYSSGELNSLYTSPSEKRITSEGLNNSNAKLFPRGTLLIGMYDTAAMKMSILHEEATFNQAIVGVPPNEFASSEYLFYALQYLKPQILMERRGVRQQNLSLAKIKKIEIPIPDAPSQKQIVTRFRALSRLKESIFSISIKKLNEYQSLKSSILAQELQPTQSEAA